MITQRHPRTRKVIVVGEFTPPKVVNGTGFIFENAAGGPYKYGYPLKATVDNLRLVEAGQL